MRNAAEQRSTHERRCAEMLRRVHTHLVRMGSTLDSPVTESTTVERAMKGLASLTSATHSSGVIRL